MLNLSNKMADKENTDGIIRRVVPGRVRPVIVTQSNIEQIFSKVFDKLKNN